MRSNNQKISPELRLVRICFKAMEGDLWAIRYLARMKGRRLSWRQTENLMLETREKVSPQERERESTQWMILTNWGPRYSREMLQN